ncbi:hypothetical protein [Actinoplanes teichomyceticus]|uniref:Uncharacterized protein n=1 Tax=Actinoplanes teichomyceticus TaxID=1867 RepID=A0A561VLP5_ACTTI|nr:hypothetical protein [Actinoplanes teichomyceticus]TWG12528.1 hypothetical protein FHX34_105395 [Actinoplanes teichomyceticus]GIF13893.1 hypothetical protein Ate01nite_39250 [Actinoplanes teichomyceticus]
MSGPLLEAAAQAFVEAAADPPYLFDPGPTEGPQDRRRGAESRGAGGPLPPRRRLGVRQQPHALPVTAVGYRGVIHDLVMLNAVRETRAAEAAITQAIAFPRAVLNER